MSAGITNDDAPPTFRKPRPSNFFRANRRRMARKGFGFYEVHMLDEAPKIGSGVRRVFAKSGTKWAYIFSPAGHAKLPVADWARMRPKELASPTPSSSTQEKEPTNDQDKSEDRPEIRHARAAA